MQCEMEFTKLQMQTDFGNKVEPLVYTGKLVLACLCILLTLNWLLLIVQSMFSYYLSSEENDKFFQAAPSNFLNKIL